MKMKNVTLQTIDFKRLIDRVTEVTLLFESFFNLKINKEYTRAYSLNVYAHELAGDLPQTILSLKKNIVLTIENTNSYIKKMTQNFCHSKLSLCNKTVKYCTKCQSIQNARRSIKD